MFVSSQVSLLGSPFQFVDRKMQQFESNNRKKDINVTGEVINTNSLTTCSTDELLNEC